MRTLQKLNGYSFNRNMHGYLVKFGLLLFLEVVHLYIHQKEVVHLYIKFFSFFFVAEFANARKKSSISKPVKVAISVVSIIVCVLLVMLVYWAAKRKRKGDETILPRIFLKINYILCISFSSLLNCGNF